MDQSTPSTAQRTFSLGSHRSLTILVVSLVLFVAACVYFVNFVILSTGTDAAYQSEAEANAQINFNEPLIKKAQEFSANTENVTVPAGRTNPFSE